MNVLLVTGVKGGVGVTTVVAHLATALSYQGKSVVALDLCTANQLGLLLGLPYCEHRGLMTQVALGESWYSACFQSKAGVYIVPHGYIEGGPSKVQSASSERIYTEVNDQLDALLENDIESIDLPFDSWLIVDFPSANNLTLDWQKLLCRADLMIMVTNTDAASISCLNRTFSNQQRAFSQQGIGASKMMYLVNKYNSSSPLERDVYDSIQHQLSTQLFPVTVHDDRNIGQSLASKQTVFEYAQHSQACRDFGLLGTWLVAGQCENQ